jgi:hypothetical protein
LISTAAKGPSKAEKAQVALEPTVGEIMETSDRVVALKEQLRKNSITPSKLPDDYRYSFIGSDLKPRADHNPRIPLYVVSVDPKIIPNHGSIDKKPFLRFLEQFVTAFTPDGQ